jgi:hypothetical protein
MEKLSMIPLVEKKLNITANQSHASLVYKVYPR